MLLSIIVPMYNAEKFIIECLESIVFQLSSNTELIIVDDFSTDNSKIVLKNFLKNLNPEKSKLIKLISLERNFGVGYARSIAISYSTGVYISSIDPDDIVACDYIEKILNILNLYSPDILQFHISRFYKKIDDGNILSKFFLKNGIYCIDENILKSFYEQSFWSFCTRVIRKNLFENINFSSLRNCEDVYALPLILLKSKSIFILDETLYYYRLNTESLSKSKKNIENTLISYNFILKDHIKLLNKNNSLFFSIVPVLRGYIQFCLVNKGYIYAKKEWMEYKKTPELEVSKISKISKISHILFMIFGVEFLYLLYLIKK